MCSIAVPLRALHLLHVSFQLQHVQLVRTCTDAAARNVKLPLSWLQLTSKAQGGKIWREQSKCRGLAAYRHTEPISAILGPLALELGKRRKFRFSGPRRSLQRPGCKKGQHAVCRCRRNTQYLVPAMRALRFYEARCRRCQQASPKCGIRLSQHVFMQSKSSSGMKVPKTRPRCNFGQAVVCHQDSAHTALVSMHL